MYDINQQLDNTSSVLTDITDLTEQDEAKRNRLVTIQGVVDTYSAEGLSPDGVALLHCLLSDLRVGNCGLESFGDDPRMGTKYVSDQIGLAIGEAEEDLSSSMESFFDVFKSFNSKALTWIDGARRDITNMQSELPRGGKATVQVGGSLPDLEKSVASTADLITYLVTGYRKEIDRTAEELAEQVRKVFSNRANFGIAIRNMKKLKVNAPSGFDNARGHSHSSGPLFGGTTLVITLDGRDSEAQESKGAVVSEIEVTTESVLAASKKLMAALNEVERFLKSRKGTEDAISRGSDRKNYLLAIPAAMGIVMTAIGGPIGSGSWAAILGVGIGLTAPEVRRRFQLIFEDDNQRELVEELKAAAKTMDNSLVVARRAVSDLLAAGKALKA